MWGDSFPNVDKIQNVSCPVFIIHGTRDEIVPFWNGEDLFLNAPIQWRACPYWVESAGHNNVETSFKEDNLFFKRFQEFLQDHVEEYGRNPHKSSLSEGPASGSIQAPLPRPPRSSRGEGRSARSGSIGVKGYKGTRATEQDIDSSSAGLMMGVSSNPLHASSYSGSSSSNLSSSPGSEESFASAEIFPVVVSSLDISMHAETASVGNTTATTATTTNNSSSSSSNKSAVASHDIVLEGISPADKAVELRELSHEFDKHYAPEPHNTI
jgi:hypothetical protein